jgi:hypothetical protein
LHVKLGPYFGDRILVSGNGGKEGDTKERARVQAPEIKYRRGFCETGGQKFGLGNRNTETLNRIPKMEPGKKGPDIGDRKPVSKIGKRKRGTVEREKWPENRVQKRGLVTATGLWPERGTGNGSPENVTRSRGEEMVSEDRTGNRAGSGKRNPWPENRG